jgi:hypothetical protein
MNQAGQNARGKGVLRVATVLTGMTGLAVVGGTAATVAPAYASTTNGQKVEVCGLSHYGSVSVQGTNQNGAYAETGWRNPGDNSCWEFTNYWWKGYIYINYIVPGTGEGFDSAYIPARGPGWVTVVV